MLLLTDGSVLCQESYGLNWAVLRPDPFGSYLNGTWVNVSAMHHTRLYYTSAVLNDGRVLIAGGEYSDGSPVETNTVEIYDPVLDFWKEIAGPAGWTKIGDATSVVLPDGRVLMGNIDDTRTAIFDPATDTWSAGPTKGDKSSEETWVLATDGTVVAVQCSNTPHSEKYVPGLNQWVDAGELPVNLVEDVSIEIGPGMTLPNGKSFFVGATGHTALYTPPAQIAKPGTWTAGRDFQKINNLPIGCKDSAGCLMPNGKVLIAAGPVGDVNNYLIPTYFFEYDGTKLNRIADPANSGDEPYWSRMMLLPTGEVLYAADKVAAAAPAKGIYLYQPDGAPLAAWRPVITSCPTSIDAGVSFTIAGQQLNGLSQAVSYGDDAQMATNYPIVRITNKSTGKVTYGRTYNHSTMAIATGTTQVHTSCVIPYSADTGDYDLVVIANGIASLPVTIQLFSYQLRIPLDDELIAILIGSLADGDLWVLGPNGPIPVDPWGPKIVQQAREAYEQIAKGAREILEIGARLDGIRQQGAGGVGQIGGRAVVAPEEKKTPVH